MCFLSFFPVCVVFSRIQERAKVDAERKELERLQTLYSELKSQLDNCPESMREQLQEQMQRVSVSSPIPFHPISLPAAGATDTPLSLDSQCYVTMLSRYCCLPPHPTFLVQAH